MAIDKDKLVIMLSAGYIKRYHTLAITGENTVAHHTYGVAQIMRYITEDSWPNDLMRACLDHDVAEYYTGDVPYPAKELFPEIQKVMHNIEVDMNIRNGMAYDLREDERNVLRAADLLDMCYFGLFQRDLGNKNGEMIVRNAFDALKKINVLGKNYVEIMKDIQEKFNVTSK